MYIYCFLLVAAIYLAFYFARQYIKHFTWILKNYLLIHLVYQQMFMSSNPFRLWDTVATKTG